MKRWATVLLLAAFLPVEALLAQQTGRIVGLVTSDQGQPLSGANVVVVGTQIGTLTGQDGRYVIPGVPAGTHQVQASLIGYGSATVTVTVTPGGTATANFQLTSQAIALEEIVAVGYGQQRRVTLTGSVASVQGREIEANPVANMSNALAGKLPGVITVNSSGEPGYDGATIRIRGSHTLGNNNPLIVIDGVPDRGGGLDRLDPQDIESITVLKDASAAIYGARAANGVILIQTKRGRAGTPPEFSVTINQGFTQPTRIPEMADAATYMEMLNEISLYRGRPLPYSEEEIQKARDGSDPWRYPNTDWFAEVMKPLSFQTRGIMALRGSSERLGYYLSLSGLTEDGFYRNSATRYNQYSFRSNIDGQVAENLNVRFDVTGRFEDRNFPNRSAGAIFRSLMRGKPNLPARWPNGL
ncbi:MAG TPA: SusC/RagA family TonB-linked outer membrane protein, partial [Longimicrobiales bacterium]